MQYDREITISTAGSRKAADWKLQRLRWSEFCERLRVPVRSSETITAYLAMKKAQQDELEQSAKRYSVSGAGKPTLTIRRSNQVKSLKNRGNQLILDANTPFTQDGAWCKILCKRNSTKSRRGAMESAQAAG